MSGITAVVICGMLLGAHADGQSWRGMGRIAGKVTDEAGKPLDGVVIKAFLASANGGTEIKTNKNGEWALGGIARGDWALDVSKDGYETRTITVSVGEMSRLPPMTITLKRATAPADPNIAIRGDLEKAAALMNAKQFAEARAIYEALSAKYPEIPQFYALIARTYYGENALDKSISYLEQAQTKEPGNVEVTLLLGNILIEKGEVEKGRAMLATVDDSRVKDPAVFLNVGIALINRNRSEDALPYFSKNIALFPTSADAYYYRGITQLQLGKTAEAKADLEKFVAMAPDAPEAATAKKILEQIK